MSVYENFDEQKQFACRVIADHARATAFAIADGILPGNEGRNYVLRKIMRRAIYHGRDHLGFTDLFFNKVCDFVIEQMKDAYPELETQREFIGKMVRLEEERFGATMTVGLQKLDELFAVNKNPDFTEFAKLYDTFGTPRDLIRVKLEEQNVEIAEEAFNEKFDQALQEIQKTSEIGKTKQAEKIKPIYAELQNAGVKSKFHGYTETFVEGAKVLALVKDDQQVDELGEGEEGLIVLDNTPFYAEAGGQIGDTGWISGQWSGGSDQSSGKNQSSLTTDHRPLTSVRVFDTFAPIQGISLHKSKVEKGVLRVGDEVTAKIDDVRRDAVRRNHTGTHLVHSALREVLGTHVKQAGSVVAPDYLRFDFSHYQPISAEELKQIEELVAREILKNSKMETKVMSLDEAKKTGAMALFGEKYGSDVRVVYVGDGEFSKELCGGTHVNSTGDIGLFRITADEAVASGVRRIRAITGLDAIERFREDEELIARSLQALKTQRDNLPNAIEKLQEELKRVKRENDELKMKIATGAVGGASSDDEAKDVNGVKVIAKTVEGLDKGGMRHLSDTLMSKIKSGVVIVAKTEDGKVSFIVRVSDDLTDKVKAGEIVKQIAPIVGGRGGGKPDMAEGGGTDASKLNDALEASYKSVEQMLD